MCVCVPLQVRDSGYADYVRPPIDSYHTLQFGSFDEISEVGYKHASELMSNWVTTGRLAKLFAEVKIESKNAATTHESKFTDLAELVSRINRPSVVSVSSAVASTHVSDDEMSVTSEPAIASAALEVTPRRRKAGSEGTSLGSVTVSTSDAEDEDDGDRRLHDFDDEEISLPERRSS